MKPEFIVEVAGLSMVRVIEIKNNMDMNEK